MAVYNLPTIEVNSVFDVAYTVPESKKKEDYFFSEISKQWPEDIEQNEELYREFLNSAVREKIETAAIDETLELYFETFKGEEPKAARKQLIELVRTAEEPFIFDMESIQLTKARQTDGDADKIELNSGKSEEQLREDEEAALEAGEKTEEEILAAREARRALDIEPIFFETPLELAKFAVRELKKQIVREINKVENLLVYDMVNVIEASAKPSRFPLNWLTRKKFDEDKITEMSEVFEVFEVLPDFWPSELRTQLSNRARQRGVTNMTLEEARIYQMIKELTNKVAELAEERIKKNQPEEPASPVVRKLQLKKKEKQ